MGNIFKSLYHEHKHEIIVSEEEHLLHEVIEHDKLNNMSEAELILYMQKFNDDEFLHTVFDAEKDTYTKLHIVNRITEINKKHGLQLYLFLLKNTDLPFFQGEVFKKKHQVTKQKFGFDSEKK